LLANVLGAPLAAGLLSMDGLGGLQGWQWLFMLEGIPAIILGGVVLFALPSTPQAAPWLNDAEKELLTEDVSRS
jgi:ACS family tartrate transporter-like MFS transporter